MHHDCSGEIINIGEEKSCLKWEEEDETLVWDMHNEVWTPFRRWMIYCPYIWVRGFKENI